MTLLSCANRQPRCLFGGLSLVLLLSTVLASSIVPERVAVSQTVELPTRYAIVVVGLPGDDEHRQKFQQMTDVWRQWLVEVAGVQESNLMLLTSNDAGDASPATAASISARIAELAEKIQPNDSLWAFLLGHGSQDDRHGWFHIAGPDLNAVQWAELFAPLEVQEQVFWFTQSASGRFVKPFARAGRVVISATDDGEVNETRFPQALTDIMRLQLKKDNVEPASIPSSVLDLFRQTALRVNQSFEDQQLVPTEHAQFDDNGDGLGTEVGDAASQADISSEAAQSVVDGALANRIRITLTTTTEAKSQP